MRYRFAKLIAYLALLIRPAARAQMYGEDRYGRWRHAGNTRRLSQRRRPRPRKPLANLGRKSGNMLKIDPFGDRGVLQALEAGDILALPTDVSFIFNLDFEFGGLIEIERSLDSRHPDRVEITDFGPAQQ